MIILLIYSIVQVFSLYY